MFLAFPVPAGSAPEAVAGAGALGIEGLSVTMPHKTDVAAVLAGRLSPTAQRLGAVNTVVRRGGELWGENTDGAGLLDALRHDEGFDPAGRRCVVVGAGGAGRAVTLALAEAGAAEVVVANRTPGRAEAAAALAGDRGRVGSLDEVGEADLVVNATPVGMGGAVPGPGHDPAHDLPLDPARLGPGQLVVDLVYHPPVTPLLEAARARGATAVNGVGMLVHQAAHGFRLWTGEEPPLEVMSAAALGGIAHLKGNSR